MTPQTNKGPELWAITCYFPFDDPSGDRRRLRAYREFRRRLAVPLVTVELARNGRFDLNASDADTLIQIEGGATLWQKERLMNVALEALPRKCDIVLWTDCDVVLDGHAWPQEVRCALNSHSLVQPFSSIRYLSETDPSGDLARAPVSEVRRSVVRLLAEGRLPAESFGARGYSDRLRYSPGLAWAAQRKLLDQHGFYDGMILGSGDKAIFSAACGRQRDYVRAYCGGRRHAEHYLIWADAFAESVRGRIGRLENDAYHLFHGNLADRGYQSRYEGFEAFGFDPDRDLQRTAYDAWTWSSAKPEMHEFVREMFERRRGAESAKKSQQPATIARLPLRQNGNE